MQTTSTSLSLPHSKPHLLPKPAGNRPAVKGLYRKIRREIMGQRLPPAPVVLPVQRGINQRPLMVEAVGALGKNTSNRAHWASVRSVG